MSTASTGQLEAPSSVSSTLPRSWECRARSTRESLLIGGCCEHAADGCHYATSGTLAASSAELMASPLWEALGAATAPGMPERAGCCTVIRVVLLALVGSLAQMYSPLKRLPTCSSTFGVLGMFECRGVINGIAPWCSQCLVNYSSTVVLYALKSLQGP
jgi:hypothetical protein